MKKTIALASCITGLLLLAACSSANPAPDRGNGPGQITNDSARGRPPQGGGPGGQGSPRGPSQMTPEENQQAIDEANAAADKTEITKDQFTAEMQTLMQAQQEQFQQQNGDQQSSFPNGNRPVPGGNGMPDMLTNATTFYKYTDPNGQEALLALDADGKVVTKWPRAGGFGNRGGPGGFPGGQPPAGGPSPGQQ